jgi:hypothetical protein
MATEPANIHMGGYQIIYIDIAVKFPVKMNENIGMLFHRQTHTDYLL